MKKVLSLILSLMLVFTMLPGALMVQATEYETVTVLTGGKDFSTVFSGSGTQLSGSGYTLQNVSSSFTSMAVKEKSEVSQTIADGVTSEKVLVLTPSGTANPTARFKGFTQTPGGSPIRIKFKMYLENGTHDSLISKLKSEKLSNVGFLTRICGGKINNSSNGLKALHIV